MCSFFRNVLDDVVVSRGVVVVFCLAGGCDVCVGWCATLGSCVDGGDELFGCFATLGSGVIDVSGLSVNI